ncbi:uncharacterized protein LOC134274191 [Saccostrea cucullata]|uniref:uncharacterized protein LOC134274191 n=1 Tax=Saccostrea cuccullata TaxID=36930 RepID=UPI002ED01E75
MNESNSSHEERVIHAAPQIGLSGRPGLTQNSQDEFTTQDALDIFTDKLDRALRRQKQEIVSELSLAQKSTEKKVPDFRYQGNKIQFEFNAERETDIRKVLNLLENNRLETAKEILNSTITHLNKRNKIVRIADKYGWDVVQEYEDDPITDDADDATKLRQAIFQSKEKKHQQEALRQNNTCLSWMNEIADVYSKIFDFDDWSVGDHIFQF